MKRIVLIMVMCIAWLGITSTTTNKDNAAPKIELKAKSYDFGTIKEEKGKVSCEFRFTNTGNAPLVIISAIAGCGCTTPEFDEEPIAPGKSSAIKVTYNPKGRPGEFVKNITVRTNDPKNKKINLKISGTVIPKQATTK